MSSSKHVTAYKKGHMAESLASLYFMSKGYKILKRRFKTRYGEVDIILKKKDKISFVEVKARKNIDDAIHSINPRGRSRIENAARQFLAENEELVNCEMSFDVFCVAINKSLVPIKFVHLDNAWMTGS